MIVNNAIGFNPMQLNALFKEFKLLTFISIHFITNLGQ
jgi:hypothetical protein